MPKAARYIRKRPLLVSALGFMLLLRQFAKIVLEVIRDIFIGMFYMAMTIGESLMQQVCGSFGMVVEPANTLRKASDNSNNPHASKYHPASLIDTVSPSSSSRSSSRSSSPSSSGCSSPMTTPVFGSQFMSEQLFKEMLSEKLKRVEVAGQASLGPG